MQDFLRMYSNLVERCFNSCCNDFTSKALSSKEVCTYLRLLQFSALCSDRPLHRPPSLISFSDILMIPPCRFCRSNV